VIFGFAVLSLLDFFGVIWHNSFFASFYSAKGLDVSHYQGRIDWQKVAKTGRYEFVYIKATEGDDFIDDSFATNWQQAKTSGFRVGAYHFFSTRSSGEEQAHFFIATVPQDAVLPPMIDVEIDTHQNKEVITHELKTLLVQLENHYHKPPILYVTYDTYKSYIEGSFDNDNIWIRDIFKPPTLEGKDWLLWQYNSRGHVDGINTYVDINVAKSKL
jgi:lysozyme